MIPRRIQRALIVFGCLLLGSLAGCLFDRSTRRDHDFDFDLTPPEDSETDDARSEIVSPSVSP